MLSIYSAKQLLKFEQAKEYLENPDAFAVAAPAAEESGAATSAAEAKEEEKPAAAEEESDDDMVSRRCVHPRIILNFHLRRALVCLTRIHVLLSLVIKSFRCVCWI